MNKNNKQRHISGFPLKTKKKKRPPRTGASGVRTWCLRLWPRSCCSARGARRGAGTRSACAAPWAPSWGCCGSRRCGARAWSAGHENGGGVRSKTTGESGQRLDRHGFFPLPGWHFGVTLFWPTATWLWVKTIFMVPFWRAPPILEPILVVIGMFTGGAIWILTHGHMECDFGWIFRLYELTMVYDFRYYCTRECVSNKPAWLTSVLPF